MIGFIPSWQFSLSPEHNPNMSAFMPTPTPVTPGMSGLRGFGNGSSTASVAVAPDGTTVMPDGTSVAPDGTATTPDGTTVAPDGTTTLPDGTTIAPDGSATAPDGTPIATAAVPAPVSSTLPATIPSASLQSEIDGFLLNTPSPKSADVVSFLKLYRGEDRLCAAQALIARGLNAHMVASALRHLGVTGAIPTVVCNLLSLAVASAAAYHGVRRHHGSVIGGAWWFVMGGLFPVLTSVVALGQGYGKPRPLAY
jgi:hypothetical protein